MAVAGSKGRGGSEVKAEGRVAGESSAWKGFEDIDSEDRNISVSLQFSNQFDDFSIADAKTHLDNRPRSPDNVTILALSRDGPSHSTMWSLTKSTVMFSCECAGSVGNRRVACSATFSIISPTIS